MYKLSQRSLNNLEGVEPNLVLVIKTAISTSPVDFTVTEGVRTTQRQKDLYEQGRTKQGDIVTWVDGIIKKSNHQIKDDGYGYAVDIYPYYNGSVQVSDKQVIEKLKLIAEHIKKTAISLGINIEWGGDWKKKDMHHFELNK